MASNAPIVAAVFASGNGSNAENILRFAQNSGGRLSIPLLICDKEGAGVLARAEKLGVPRAVIPVEGKGREARRAQEDKILALLAKQGIKWAFLAGYMQIISPEFLKFFADETLGVNRVVNIHPSLLPQFPGKDGYGDAWNAGVKKSGVTLHYVDEGVDTGPVIAQKTFDRRDDDTLETFRARGMELEYQIYTEFLASLIAETAALKKEHA